MIKIELSLRPLEKPGVTSCKEPGEIISHIF